MAIAEFCLVPIAAVSIMSSEVLPFFQVGPFLVGSKLSWHLSVLVKSLRQLRVDLCISDRHFRPAQRFLDLQFDSSWKVYTKETYIINAEHNTKPKPDDQYKLKATCRVKLAVSD